MWSFYYGQEGHSSPDLMTASDVDGMGGRPAEDREPPGRLVIEDGTVYEIDLECIRCRQQKQKSMKRQ